MTPQTPDALQSWLVQFSTGERLRVEATSAIFALGIAVAQMGVCIRLSDLLIQSVGPGVTVAEAPIADLRVCIVADMARLKTPPASMLSLCPSSEQRFGLVDDPLEELAELADLVA